MEGKESVGILERIASGWEARAAVDCSGTHEGGQSREPGRSIDERSSGFAGTLWREAASLLVPMYLFSSSILSTASSQSLQQSRKPARHGAKESDNSNGINLQIPNRGATSEKSSAKQYSPQRKPQS